MKFLFFISIITTIVFELNKSAVINEIKSKAGKAYSEKNYLQAIQFYKPLLSTYKIQDENIVLNVAHAYFRLRNYKAAAKYYQVALKTAAPKFYSSIFQQLGVIASYTGNDKQALRYSKESLKCDPSNDLARYNFELLMLKTAQGGAVRAKKSAKGVPAEAQQPRPIDDGAPGGDDFARGQNTAPTGTPRPPSSVAPDGNVNGMQAPGMQHTDLKPGKEGNAQTNALQSQRFKEIPLTQQKARMILEMMQSQEQQFLNNKRKYLPGKNNNQPDW